MCLLAVSRLSLAESPLVIAHRGASDDAPENTVVAVKLGFEQGAEFVEVDLRLTKDGRVVLLHDATTKRTGGEEFRGADETLATLQRLDVGAFKGSQYAGERIPTLEEALAVVPAGKGMFLEIKTGPEIVPALERAISKSDLKPEQIVFISFNFDALKLAKERMPQHRAYFLPSLGKKGSKQSLSEDLDAAIARSRGLFDGLDLKASLTSPEFVERARAAELPVYVWTVNDEKLARAMIEAGVAGITTDRPRWLRGLLAE
jgi:glycerophosphoryl diester phosphodiesterase